MTVPRSARARTFPRLSRSIPANRPAPPLAALPVSVLAIKVTY